MRTKSAIFTAVCVSVLLVPISQAGISAPSNVAVVITPSASRADTAKASTSPKPSVPPDKTPTSPTPSVSPLSQTIPWDGPYLPDLQVPEVQPVGPILLSSKVPAPMPVRSLPEASTFFAIVSVTIIAIRFFRAGGLPSCIHLRSLQVGSPA